MQDKRRYERYPDALGIDIAAPTGEVKTYTTRDVSDGGVFVMANVHNQLPVGMEVRITPTSHTHDGELPILRGRVAHRNKQGMGIEFLDPGFPRP